MEIETFIDTLILSNNRMLLICFGSVWLLMHEH